MISVTKILLHLSTMNLLEEYSIHTAKNKEAVAVTWQ